MRMMIMAVAAAFCFAAGAEARSVTVPLQGVDLSAPAGQDVALERIQKAVKRVCLDAGIYGMPSKANRKACEKATMGAVMAKLQIGPTWLAQGPAERAAVAALASPPAPESAAAAPLSSAANGG